MPTFFAKKCKFLKIMESPAQTEEWVRQCGDFSNRGKGSLSWFSAGYVITNA